MIISFTELQLYSMRHVQEHATGAEDRFRSELGALAQEQSRLI
jgi:hypothetical protein